MTFLFQALNQSKDHGALLKKFQIHLHFRLLIIGQICINPGFCSSVELPFLHRKMMYSHYSISFNQELFQFFTSQMVQTFTYMGKIRLDISMLSYELDFCSIFSFFLVYYSFSQGLNKGAWSDLWEICKNVRVSEILIISLICFNYCFESFQVELQVAAHPIIKH